MPIKFIYGTSRVANRCTRKDIEKWAVIQGQRSGTRTAYNSKAYDLIMMI